MNAGQTATAVRLVCTVGGMYDFSTGDDLKFKHLVMDTATHLAVRSE